MGLLLPIECSHDGLDRYSVRPRNGLWEVDSELIPIKGLVFVSAGLLSRTHQVENDFLWHGLFSSHSVEALDS